MAVKVKKTTFGAFFPDFRVNKNFSGKSASVAFLFLGFCYYAEFHKRTKEQIQKKLGNRCTDR